MKRAANVRFLRIPGRSLFATVTLVLGGCVSAPAASPAVPAYFVDEDASELSIRLASGQELDPATAKIFPPIVEGYLNEMIERRSGSLGSASARFRAEIVSHSGKGWFMFVPCLIVGVYFGCPMGTSLPGDSSARWT